MISTTTTVLIISILTGVFSIGVKLKILLKIKCWLLLVETQHFSWIWAVNGKMPSPFLQPSLEFNSMLYGLGPSSTSTTVASVPVQRTTMEEDEKPKKNHNRWYAIEKKILIEAYKESRVDRPWKSRGKKAIGTVMYVRWFHYGYIDAIFPTTKSLEQLKEKWRILDCFRSIKPCVTPNSKTGRGRETFDHYEAIDEFMGCSDRVRPRFITETAIIKKRSISDKRNFNWSRVHGKLAVTHWQFGRLWPIRKTVIIVWHLLGRIQG